MTNLNKQLGEIGSFIWSALPVHKKQELDVSMLRVKTELARSVELQGEILNTIKAKDLSALPVDAMAVYQRLMENKKVGVFEHEVDMDNGASILGFSGEGGTDHLIMLKPSEKTVIDDHTRRITGYYLIDPESQKILDLSDIWQTIEKKRGKTIVPVLTGKYVSPETWKPSSEGIFVVLNSMLQAMRTGKIGLHLPPSHLMSAYMSPGNIPHELAHTTQFFGESNLSLKTIKTLSSLSSFIIGAASKLGSKSAREKKEYSREVSVLWERNAQAFALNLIRVMRNQQCDLAPGLSTKEMLYATNTALQTHQDFGPLKSVNGQPFNKQTVLTDPEVSW